MQTIDVLREIRVVAGRVMAAADESPSPEDPRYEQLDVERMADLFVHLSRVPESEVRAAGVLPHRVDTIGELVSRVNETGGDFKIITRLAVLALIYTSAVDGVDTKAALDTTPDFRVSARKASRVG